jgi:RimJ/RimL family protein N-acetyltransferase
MDPPGGQDAKAGIRDVRIRGPRLLLRALQPGEIEEEWQAMVTADPMVIAELPEEAGFKARLRRSGHLEDGWLDLAVDLDGVSVGRIQTFVPAGRALPPGTFDVGIGLREDARGKGYGREALTLLTDWLFEHAAARAVEASTDPANAAMRTVFRKAGWMPAGSLTELGREWVMYRITRQEWEDSLQAWCRTATRLPTNIGCRPALAGQTSQGRCRMAEPPKPTVILETPRDPDRVSSFLNIRVKDIDAVYAEWSARGAQFLTPPKQHAYEKRCYIRDPDGHLIEVEQTTDPEGDWSPAHWPASTPAEESE